MSAATQLIRFLRSRGFIPDLPLLQSIYQLQTGILLELERLRVCTEKEALLFLSDELQLAIVDPALLSTGDTWNPDELIEGASTQVCWKYHSLPYRRSSAGVHIITDNPLNEEARQYFEFVFQDTVVFELAQSEQIIRALRKVAPESVTTYDTFTDTNPTVSIEIINPDKRNTAGEQETEAPPIIKLCNKIITDAVENAASDIHLEPTETGLDVRFRIHGVMQHIFQIPKRLQPYVTARFKILSSLDVAEKRRPQDGRARARINGEPTDIRVSAVPTAHGEKLVLRLLSQSTYTQNFESLGIPKKITESILKDLSSNGKMILVTGPTGAGKSTTLYTFLQHLQDGTLNIETVEDPVEYRMKGINQIQVNEQTGITFASALRSILRQDPDVIMIGEIRDTETATIALQAAHTGHLVLSTLHTNDALSAIQRLLQLGCPNYLVAGSLAGILAQRLIRTACTHCSQPICEADREQVAHRLESLGIAIDPDLLIQTTGCTHCRGTGFAGRTGIYSYVHITPELEALIVRGAPAHELTQQAYDSGYTNLRSACISLLKQQKTTLGEVLPYLQLRDNSGETVEVINTAIEPDTSAKLTKTKILLIEDDESVRSVLTMLLEKEMYDVIEAKNGLEGLELVYEKYPQIILCDLMMPVMDGKDFLLRLKKNSKTAHIPVVMLTAADGETNEIDLLQLGATDFISKTSSSNVMLTRIRKALT